MGSTWTPRGDRDDVRQNAADDRAGRSRHRYARSFPGKTKERGKRKDNIGERLLHALPDKNDAHRPFQRDRGRCRRHHVPLTRNSLRCHPRCPLNTTNNICYSSLRTDFIARIKKIDFEFIGIFLTGEQKCYMLRGTRTYSVIFEPSFYSTFSRRPAAMSLLPLRISRKGIVLFIFFVGL